MILVCFLFEMGVGLCGVLVLDFWVFWVIDLVVIIVFLFGGVIVLMWLFIGDNCDFSYLVELVIEKI